MKLFNKTSTAEQVTEGLDLSGKTILITGCNSGIGLETMRVLALRGARVIGAARTMVKAKKACASVKGDTLPLVCDLAKPASIRAAIKKIKEPLNVIIANAGVMALQERILQHGVEAHMFTNHVGHFMLITGLVDQLTSDGRVVVVSSAAHSYARGKGIDFEDLAWERPYAPWAAYGHSKLANILFTKELAKRLPKGQTANALHPGVIDTGLFRHLPDETAAQMKNSFGAKSTALGAATSVYLAAHPELAKVSGEYLSSGASGKPSALAQDKKAATKLWKVTEKLVATL